MPRDGSGIFTKPFPDVIAGATIESAVHNGIVADFTADANVARPIVAGGTAANTAKTARDNLDCEVAGAQVTNYDSHVWENGSFYSNVGATGAPEATLPYVGVATMHSDTNFGVIKARSVAAVSTPTYVRVKNTGVWGAWTAEADDKVSVTGDTMSGALSLSYSNPDLIINNNPEGVDGSDLWFMRNTLGRWLIRVIPDGNGGNIQFARFNDAGSPTGTPLIIDRATGRIFAESGVAFTSVNEYSAYRTGTRDVLAYTPGYYQEFDSVSVTWKLVLNSLPMLTVSGAAATITPVLTASNGISTTTLNLATAGFVNTSLTATGGYLALNLASGCSVRQSVADNHMYFVNGGADSFRVQNDGNLLMLGAKLPYRPGGGPWLDNSDERIKNVIGDYDHGLDEILALRPVRYTFKGNNTGPDEAPSGLAAGASPKEGETPPPATVPYANSPHYAQAKDGTEHIGLIAQAVETVMPEMVSQHAATIDGQPVTDLRTLDAGPLVFALVNAVKELSARLEALETRRL